MIVALHSRLLSNHAAEYERDHARVPPELVEAFARVGIHDWSIWRSGDDLFHVVDCDDFTAAMRHLATDDANTKWQRSIGVHIDTFLPNGQPAPISPVWTLHQQEAEGQS